MSNRNYLSIGDVLSLLREEFPDVTISKIRFLESQGLVNPERSPSGYRKFYDHDVERLRWVLRQQREHFLPLKVIRDRLAQEDGAEGASATTPSHVPANGLAVVEEISSAEPHGVERVLEPSGAPESAERATLSMAPVLPAAPRGTTVGVGASRDNPIGVIGAGNRPAAEHGRGSNDPTRAAKGPLPAGGRSEPPPRAEDAPVVPLRAPASAPPPNSAPSTPPVGAPGAPAEHTVGAPSARPTTTPSTPSAPRTARSANAPANAPAATPRGGSVASAPDGRGSGSVAATGRRSEGTPEAPGHRQRDAVAAAPSEPAAYRPATGSRSGGEAPAFDASTGVSGVSLTAEELSAASGLSQTEVAELEGFGLAEPMVVGGVVYYDEEALTVAKLVAEFGRYGIEPRHLRPYRNAVERELGLIEQVVTPLLRQRNPEARQRAVESTIELARLGQSLRASLLRKELRRQFGT